MRKRLLTWFMVVAMIFVMTIGGSASAFAETPQISGELAWAWNVPATEDNYSSPEYYSSYGISTPTVNGSYLYVTSYDKLFKVDANTGKLIAKADLGGNVQYNRIAPTVNGGKAYIALSDSKLAVVDTSNMKVIKTITYAEGQSGYQSLTPVVYNDGKLYLGSWGGPSAGTYVEIDATTYEVTKIAEGKGFYFAGAAVNGNYVVFGSDAPRDDNSQNATLYVWDKTTKKLSSTEVAASGSIRSTIVEYNGAFYFTAKSGKLYKAVINKEDEVPVNVSEVAELGASSVCTPLIKNDKAYVGYQCSGGWDSKGAVKAINLSSGTVAETYDNIPANVTNLLYSESGKTTGKLLATYNGYPGGIWDVFGNKNFYEPSDSLKQYCMSGIAQKGNKLFYSNDSNNLIAVEALEGTALQYTVTCTSGEGGNVSPTYIGVEDGKTAEITITPDSGYKVKAVKVDGKKIDDIDLYSKKGAVSFTTDKIKKDITVEVTFEEIKEAVICNVEVSLQKGFTFYVPHKNLNVSSDLAEKYGYDDKIVEDKVSALDALVAAHIDKYGEDVNAVNANLIMGSTGSPEKMFGLGGKYEYTGFSINEGYPKDSNNQGYVVNTAMLNDGDRVEYFWYEDPYWGDTLAVFKENGNKAFSKTIKEGDSLELSLEGFMYMAGYASDELGPIENATICTLKEDEDGTLSVNDFMYDSNENVVTTDEKGEFAVNLTAGKHYLTAMAGEDEFRLVMPMLEVMVLCENHSFEKGKCSVCEKKMRQNEDFRFIIKDEIKEVGSLSSTEVVEKMKQSIKNADKNIGDSQIKLMEIQLQISEDNGNTWRNTSLNNAFKAGGLDLIIPYPEGTNGESCDFVATHMFATGENIGDIERLEITETKEGLKTHINSTSPFAVGWIVKNEEALPKTGDDTNIMLLSIIALMAVAGGTGVWAIRKKAK